MPINARFTILILTNFLFHISHNSTHVLLAHITENFRIQFPSLYLFMVLCDLVKYMANK